MAPTPAAMRDLPPPPWCVAALAAAAVAKHDRHAHTTATRPEDLCPRVGSSVSSRMITHTHTHTLDRMIAGPPLPLGWGGRPLLPALLRALQGQPRWKLASMKRPPSNGSAAAAATAGSLSIGMLAVAVTAPLSSLLSFLPPSPFTPVPGWPEAVSPARVPPTWTLEELPSTERIPQPSLLGALVLVLIFMVLPCRVRIPSAPPLQPRHSLPRRGVRCMHHQSRRRSCLRL